MKIESPAIPLFVDWCQRVGWDPNNDPNDRNAFMAGWDAAMGHAILQQLVVRPDDVMPEAYRIVRMPATASTVHHFRVEILVTVFPIGTHGQSHREWQQLGRLAGTLDDARHVLIDCLIDAVDGPNARRPVPVDRFREHRPERAMSGPCAARNCPEIGNYMLWSRDVKTDHAAPVFFCREHISSYHSVSQMGETLEQFLHNHTPEVQYANQASGQAKEVAEREQGEPINSEFRTLPSVSEIDQRQWLVGMCLNGLLSNPDVTRLIMLGEHDYRANLVHKARDFAQVVIELEDQK